MPGLAGYIEFGQKNLSACGPKPRLDEMIKPLIYYPWYKVDKLSLKNLSAACIHTGILGDKTLHSTPDAIHLLMCGEVYNDDCPPGGQLEYLIKLYRNKGKDFVKEINGSFSLLLVDEQKNLVILACDRVNSRPLLYLKTANRLYFAPELKFFFKIPDLTPEVNLTAVIDAIFLDFTINRQTLLQGVNFLDNGSVIEIAGGKFTNYHYWQYEINEGAKDLGWHYYEDKLKNLLICALKRQIKSSHKYGIFLSGGYDSRALLGCFLHEGKKPITVAFGASSDSNPYADYAIASKVAEAAATAHINMPYDLKDYLSSLKSANSIFDGVTRPLPEWPIHKIMRESHGIEVIFTGDECFGRFDNFLPNEEAALACSYIFPLHSFAYGSLPFKECCKKQFIELSANNIKKLSRSCAFKNKHNRMDYFFLKEYMLPLIGLWRYAISTEMEVRNPFYDNDILDFLKELPVKYRKGKKLFKATVKKMFPGLFAIEIARNVSKPTKEEWQEWISANKSEIEKEFFDGACAIDSFLDREKMLKLINSPAGDNKENRNSLLKFLDTGKSTNNWLTSKSPHWVYSFVGKLFSLAADFQVFLRPRRKLKFLAKHRAIYNIIKLRRALAFKPVSAGTDFKAEENERIIFNPR